MAEGSKERHKDPNSEMKKERRGFLKKIAYTTPGLIILGQLAKPTKAKAESDIPPPPW